MIKFIKIFLIVLIDVFLLSSYSFSAEKSLEPKEITSQKKEDESSGLKGFDEKRVSQKSDIDFTWRLKSLAFGTYQEPEKDSVLNFDNRLDIPRYEAAFSLRPDLYLHLGALDLSVKPRFEYTWVRWEDGIREGQDDEDDDLFINEWLARFMPSDELFISYGRENLQWGPAILISPSNPFNKENGKTNPYIEVPGLDYARLVWVPNYNWSVSFIFNTGEGRKVFFEEFSNSGAMKIDYVGNEKLFSLIPSIKESQNANVGFYGRWSVTDAMILYLDGSVVASDHENEKSGDFSGLIGGLYTFEAGPTITLEYFYNENGCTDAIEKCLPPLGTSNADDVFIRKNYGLLQFRHNSIGEVLDVILRLIYDIDDSSGQLNGILEYEIGSHVTLFAVGDFFEGDTDSEFGSVLNYSVFAGMEISF